VAHWLLRVTSVAFAAARVASIAAVAQALSIGAAVLFGLHAILPRL
jgi:hypothetical protein